jgi:hypothetical protein
MIIIADAPERWAAPREVDDMLSSYHLPTRSDLFLNSTRELQWYEKHISSSPDTRTAAPACTAEVQFEG